VIFAFDGLAKAAMAFLLALRWGPRAHCTGVIASVKLSLLLALCRRCCRVDLQGPAGAAQVFAGIALAFCLHPAGVIASIVLLSNRHYAGIIAVLRGRFCPCHASIFVLIAFALPPASRSGICPVTKQSRRVLASLPTPRHCYCWRSASIVALVTRAFLPL
jgi:urea transporter